MQQESNNRSTDNNSSKLKAEISINRSNSKLNQNVSNSPNKSVLQKEEQLPIQIKHPLLKEIERSSRLEYKRRTFSNINN